MENNLEQEAVFTEVVTEAPAVVVEVTKTGFLAKAKDMASKVNPKVVVPIVIGVAGLLILGKVGQEYDVSMDEVIEELGE